MKVTTREEEVELFNGAENIRIAFLSDLHFRWSTKKVQLLTQELTRLQPDLVIGGGDYYDLPSGRRLFKQFLAQIAQRYPTLLIRGNHEWWTGRSRFAKVVANTPAVNLDIEPYSYQSERQNTITFLGKNQPETNARSSTVLVRHNPESLKDDDFAKHDLILSGHLHGGQFIFRTSKSGAHYPASILYKHCCDRKKVGRGTLIVSKGLGDTLPLRFRCPHEIVLIKVV